MTIQVPPGFGDFSGRSASLNSRLVQLFLEEMPVHGSARPDYFRKEAEQLADDAVTKFEKTPRQAVTQIDQVLVAMQDNYTAWTAHRQELSETRAKLAADTAAALRAAETPNHHTLRLKDLSTGREFEISLPINQVKFLELPS